MWGVTFLFRRGIERTQKLSLTGTEVRGPCLEVKIYTCAHSSVLTNHAERHAVMDESGHRLHRSETSAGSREWFMSTAAPSVVSIMHKITKELINI